MFNEPCADALNAWAGRSGWEPIACKCWTPGGERPYGLVWGEMEHACAFLYEPEVIDILVAHDARGEALWGSLDGDNAWTFWGWRFKPGRCVRLNGALRWTETK